MRRLLTPEIMDDPSVDAEELARSLRYIRLVNRVLGGRSALLGHLRRWTRDWPAGEPLRLLDIATGSADIPIAAVAWGRERGLLVEVTAIDVHGKTLAEARREVESAGLCDCVQLAQLDALRLMDHHDPATFHVVHAGLFLHHLPEIRVLTMLRIMERLASVGVVWNDLIRSRVAHVAIRALTIGQPHMVRHDARVSVEAGFTRREALDLARRSWEFPPSYHANPLAQRFTVTCTKPR